MIEPQLAQKIIYEVRKLLDEEIIVANTEGLIIASTDRSRIGCFHEGAFLASQTREKRIITKEDEAYWAGVRAGVNLPIMFHGEVVGIIGITGSPEKVSRYGELLRRMTELFIQENYYHEEEKWHDRSLEAFVLEWLEKNEWDDDFTNRAKVLNIDLSKDRQAMLIHYPVSILFGPIWHQFSASVRGDSNTVVIRWGNDLLLVLWEGTRRSANVEQWKAMLEKQLDGPVAIGIGSLQPAHRVKVSFQQAKRALKVALPKSQIVYDEQLTLDLILNDVQPETKHTFIERTIAPILEDRELMDTLSALFKHNFSYKKAAEFLPVHINTLHYRLKKIEDVTGLNPKILEDQIQLYIAWRLYHP